MKQDLHELLIRSLDGTLSPREQQQLDDALSASEKLRQQKAQLLQMRNLIATLRVKRDTSFAEGVMARLSQREDPSFLNGIVSLFPKLAAACLLIFVLSLLGIYTYQGSLSGEVIIGVEDLLPEDANSIVFDTDFSEKENKNKMDRDINPIQERMERIKEE